MAATSMASLVPHKSMDKKMNVSETVTMLWTPGTLAEAIRPPMTAKRARMTHRSSNGR